MKRISIFLLSCVALLTMVVPISTEETAATTVTLSGRINDSEGNPVANVHIYAYDPDSGQQGEVDASSDGTYRISLAPGTYEVSISPPVGSKWIRKTIEEVNVDEDAILDVVLETGPVLTVRILDPGGDLITDLDGVIVEGQGLTLYWSCSGCDGPFRMALAPGTYKLEIRPPLGSELVGTTIEEMHIGEDTTLEITLEHGLFHSVSGRVLDPDGNPVANASVYAWSFLTEERDQGRTSADGSYRISLMPGMYWVEIHPPEGSGLPAQTLLNVKVSGDTILDIALKSGVILSGRVTSSDGEPVVGITVQAFDQPRNQGGRGRTSADGTYRIILMPGIYWVEISPSREGEFLNQTIFDLEVATDTVLDLITVEEGLTLSGQITDPEGKPVADAQVNIWGSEDVDPAGHTLTFADGSYSIAHLRPDAYGMIIYPPGPFPAQMVASVGVIEDMTLDITLKQGVLVSGRVTDSDGNPVAGCRVRAYAAATAQQAFQQTSTDGTYSMALMPGSYSLFIQPPEESNLSSQSVSEVQITADKTLDIVLIVRQHFTISGSVTDRFGKAMADIEVVAHRHPTSIYLGMGQGLAGTKTASDGSYQLTLEAAKYAITYGTGMGHESDLYLGKRLTDIELDEDMTLDVTIPTPDKAFLMRGAVRDEKGRGVNWAYVSAYERETGNFSWTISYPGGIYALLIAAGTYDLVLLPLNPIWQFPEQHIEDIVVEGYTIRDITLDISEPTAVEEEADLSELPRTFTLAQNYPNPFNPATTIRFDLSRSEEVDLAVYNLTGQKVATLVHALRQAGTYGLRWDGRDDDGRELGSGVYLYRLQAGEQVETRKLLLLR